MYANSIEFIAGANYTVFDDLSAYDNYGVSARFRYLRYDSGGKGLFINADFPAEPFFMANVFGGYGIKSKGPIYFEAGAGLSYGMIWGPGFGVLLGTGYISGNWYLALPIIYKSGISLDITPLIGYRF